MGNKHCILLTLGGFLLMFSYFLNQWVNFMTRIVTSCFQSWHVGFFWLCNNVKETVNYKTPAPQRSVIHLRKWLLRLCWKWESEIHMKGSLQLHYNSLLLPCRAVSWWLRARPDKLFLGFSFSTQFHKTAYLHWKNWYSSGALFYQIKCLIFCPITLKLINGYMNTV